jgi:hypothetical protein
MNPLNFHKMEWWSNKNEDGLGHVFVGFANDGKYLTFDIRKTGNVMFPVFSALCKVGAKNAHKIEAYEHYRKLFQTLDGYSIKEIDECDYGILYNKQPYKFKK